MTSILKREILQQPDAIAGFLSAQQNNAIDIGKKLRGQFHYVLIAARGSSDNAARYAQYLFGLHHRIQVSLATPSLFTTYQSPPDLSGALVIGISQSGQSPDIVAVLAEANRQNRPTLAITNDASAPLARASRYVLPLNTGEEKAVAATKTYTTSLAALALISCSLSDGLEGLEPLQKVPDYIRKTLDGLEPAMARVERYRYAEQCAVIGRGLNYATAFEVALKIKELSGIVAEPYSSADFRHGPIATVRPGFPVILVTPGGSTYPDTFKLIEELKHRRAELLVISDQPEALAEANLPLPFTTGMPEWLTPLAAIVPGQRLAMQLTIEKGMDPDQPEGLRKVTETF